MSNLESHFGVFAFPFGTHAAPLLTLVQKFSTLSPKSLFSFFSTAQSNCSISSGQVSEKYPNIKFYEVWDGVPEGQVFKGTHFEEVKIFLDATPGNFGKAVKKAEEEAGLKIRCLLTDAFLWFASDFAEKCGVRWVAFWTAGPGSLSAHMYTDLIQTKLAEIGEKVREQKATFIQGMSSVNLDEFPAEVYNLKTPLAITIYKMVEKLPKSAAVVLNSFEEIDPIIADDLKTKFKHFLSIGPFVLSSPAPPSTDKNQCLPWLEKQKPETVVYISFGTIITPSADELIALAEALETTKFPFLWSLKEHAQKLLPQGFIERTGEFGKIVSWAPQSEILAHSSVGVFVTHCGWNSVLESISYGVPMICRPFFGDQRLNSGMVQNTWKIGLRVKGGAFTKNATVEALQTILNETGVIIKANVKEMKEKALNAVKSDGSSTKNFKELLEILHCAN